MPLTLIVTDIGRAALVNAQNTGTDPVTIAEIGISASALVPSPSATTLPAEIKRISTLSGDIVDDDTIHLVVRDETADVYTIKSWALYLADGTLFAIYGQAGSIIDKTASSIMLLAIDVRFADITAATLTFGNTNFLNPPATETMQGVVQLATPAQAQTGTDPTLVPPVKAIHDAVFAWLDARFGVNNALVWNPNNDGAGSGLDADLLDGQQGSYYTNIIARLGYTPLNAANYTAADILAKFLTVDGAGSGADADLLDGQHGAYYLAASAYTAADVKTKMLTQDGAGSGLDADLLDGQDGSYYSNIAARLGFTPVRQGGGVGQGNNVVYIGWSAATRLKATVDATDLGNFVFDSHISDVWRSSNDGAGSGLDADLLDGQDGSYYTNITARLGYTPLNATSYTAADVKAKLLTVDGAGSGLDADLLDGQDSSYYTNIVARLGYTPLNATSYTAADVKAKLLTVDGAGSGIDADLLDGQDGSYYSNIIARLGYTPMNAASDIGGTAVGGGLNPVGTVIFGLWSAAPSGYVKAKGGSVGSAASGATERANADCAALFAVLWALDPTVAIIQTSAGAASARGASAAADFAANKRIIIPDFRSGFPRAWDDGRGIDAGRLLGSWQEDELESHTHPGGINYGALAAGAGAGPYASTFIVPTGATGGAETRPKNFALLFCVKY